MLEVMGPRPCLLAALITAAVFGCDGKSASSKLYEWTLIYHLPYDNDLSGAADPILAALARGMQSDRIAVVAQVDRADDRGIVRHILTRRAIERVSSPEEDAASARSLADLLSWTDEQLPARRYGIFLLGHAGPPGLSGYDTHSSEEARWLSMVDAADVIRNFRRTHNVELLFLQQCGRATVETLYEANGTARIVMASQGRMGAPNTYYEDVLEFLGNEPMTDGLSLSRTITRNEGESMYVDHVAYRGDKLVDLRQELAALLPAQPPVVDPQTRPEPTYEWNGHRYVDLLEWLEIDSTRGDELHRFRRWLDSSLMVSRSVSAAAPAEAQGWSGLSIFLPSSEAQARRNRARRFWFRPGS
jgi:hypothetical protein